MDRIARSWAMFKASLRVLSTRKELALFPVLSGIATLIVAAGFAVPALLASRTAIEAGNSLRPVSYVLFFLGYLVLAYIAIFFQAALISQADIALRGGAAQGGGDPAMGAAVRDRVARAAVAGRSGRRCRAVRDRAGRSGVVAGHLPGRADSGA